MRASLASMLRWLVLPWGTTSGQRIVLDSTAGEISLYDASDVLVAEVTISGGSENEPGFIAYAATGRRYYGMLTQGGVEFGEDGLAYVQTPSITHVSSAGADPTFLLIRSGWIGDTATDGSIIRLISMDGATRPRVEVDAVSGSAADMGVSGILTAGNMAFGSTVITPVASTPTSVTVTGLAVEGSTFYGHVTANSSALAVIQEVSATGAASTGVTLWIYSTSTTNRTLNWMVIGQ